MSANTQPECLSFVALLFEGLLQKNARFERESDDQGFSLRSDVIRVESAALFHYPEGDDGQVVLRLRGVFDKEPVGVEVDEKICQRLGISEVTVSPWDAAYSRGFYEKNVEVRLSLATMQWFDSQFGHMKQSKGAASDKQWDNALADLERVRQKVASLAKERKEHVVEVFADFSKKCLT